jgi:hypothetical protein
MIENLVNGKRKTAWSKGSLDKSKSMIEKGKVADAKSVKAPMNNSKKIVLTAFFCFMENKAPTKATANNR